MKHRLTWFQVITFLFVTGAALPGRADLQLPTLKSGTVTYSNVTVYSQTDQDLYISHAQGLGNIKISSLDDDSLRALGLKEAKSPPDTVMARGLSETMDKLQASLGTVNGGAWAAQLDKFRNAPEFKPSGQTLGIAVAVMVIVYVFYCFCLKLICSNAGAPAGPLIWFPVLQMFPLLRAAKFPAWYFLLFLIPLVNLGMQIWWSFRIATACGKGPVLAILLILPGINIFAFLYLAFSKGQAEETTPAGPIRLEGLSNA